MMFNYGIGQVRAVSPWDQCQGSYYSAATAAIVIGTAFILRRYWSARVPFCPKQLIIVTGCDSGLGYSLALHCKRNGAKVLASVLDVDGKIAQDLVSKDVYVARLDLTDELSVQNFVKETERIVNMDNLQIRALVNNAGVMVFGEFEWQLERQARAQIEVNLLGTMSITRQLMPLLRAHSSRIINVTSHCAFAALPSLSVYGASKAAVQAWTTSLRVELGKYGVSVVSFVPGSFYNESHLMAQQEKHFNDMRTGMNQEARHFYGYYFEEHAKYLKSVYDKTDVWELTNPLVYQTFDGALLDKYPSATYICEPWRYTIYHTLFRITPTRVRDWLVKNFVQLPKWNPTNSPSATTLPLFK